MRIDILTTFPEMFSPQSPAALGVSIPKRAQETGQLDLHPTDIRAYTTNKHEKTDARPYGGGPGMVMSCQPVWDAVQAVEAMDPTPAQRILLTPQGVPLTQEIVEELSQKPRLLMIAGHYEGIDERVIEKLAPLEISIGDYILSGGELAAMVLIDAITRLLPGVLGHQDSAIEDSFSQPRSLNADGNEINPNVLKQLNIPPHAKLLDCPHYTRPQIWEG
ncbi:MAG: tRNA (guanosine(37)-N1)-methyltransferase TrmD, partial [Phycisphaerales bacterium]